MTWTLNASGHTNTLPHTKAGERKLATLLASALAAVDPADISSAHFSGNHYTADLDELRSIAPDAAEPDPTAAAERETVLQARIGELEAELVAATARADDAERSTMAVNLDSYPVTDSELAGSVVFTESARGVSATCRCGHQLEALDGKLVVEAMRDHLADSLDCR